MSSLLKRSVIMPPRSMCQYQFYADLGSTFWPWRYSLEWLHTQYHPKRRRSSHWQDLNKYWSCKCGLGCRRNYRIWMCSNPSKPKLDHQRTSYTDPYRSLVHQEMLFDKLAQHAPGMVEYHWFFLRASKVLLIMRVCWNSLVPWLTSSYKYWLPLLFCCWWASSWLAWKLPPHLMDQSSAISGRMRSTVRSLRWSGKVWLVKSLLFCVRVSSWDSRCMPQWQTGCHLCALRHTYRVSMRSQQRSHVPRQVYQPKLLYITRWSEFGWL